MKKLFYVHPITLQEEYICLKNVMQSTRQSAGADDDNDFPAPSRNKLYE